MSGAGLEMEKKIIPDCYFLELKTKFRLETLQQRHQTSQNHHLAYSGLKIHFILSNRNNLTNSKIIKMRKINEI